MPPKIKPDDIVDALLDSRVVEALAKALSPFIKKSIDEALDERLAALAKSVQEVKQANDRLQAQVGELRKANADLRQHVDSQSTRVDALEAYSRLDNLIIKGLPDRSYAERGTHAAADADSAALADSQMSVEATVITFCKETLNVDVTTQDISTAHRLKAGPRDLVRPVIVRFTNRRTRDAVFRAKKVLKSHSKQIYISEHLTKTSSELFFEARKLAREKKIHSTWTQNGQVHVKASSDPAVKPILIKCRADLPRNG
jgi:hypothetical protein